MSHSFVAAASGRQRPVIAAIALVLSTAAALTTAQPASAQVAGECVDVNCFNRPALTVSKVGGSVIVEDTRGVRNDADIVVHGTQTDVARATVRDTFGVQAGTGCIQATLSQAVCTGSVTFVDVNLWFGDDWFEVNRSGGARFETQVFAGPGSDIIDGGLLSGPNVLDGESGNDFIDGGWDDDLLYGGQGIDNLDGSDGDDLLQGGSENDVLYGSHGNDDVVGGDGADDVRGADDTDNLFGGAGDDYVDSGGNDGAFDFLACGSGSDRYYMASGQDAVSTDPAETCETRLSSPLPFPFP